MQGSFGWVLATSQPQRILIRCRGPAYGSSMNSFRAEAYGLLSVSTFLHLLAVRYQQQIPPTIIWCDNLSVIRTVNNINSSMRPAFPNETLRPSWDVLQAICHQLSNLPDITIQHIKGHQDTTTRFQDLPFPATLNVEADKLASSFHQLSDQIDVQGPLFRDQAATCTSRASLLQATTDDGSDNNGGWRKCYNISTNGTTCLSTLDIKSTGRVICEQSLRLHVPKLWPP
jgi:hypothetical protein